MAVPCEIYHTNELLIMVWSSQLWVHHYGTNLVVHRTPSWFLSHAVSVKQKNKTGKGPLQFEMRVFPRPVLYDLTCLFVLLVHSLHMKIYCCEGNHTTGIVANRLRNTLYFISVHIDFPVRAISVMSRVICIMQDGQFLRECTN